MLPQNFVTNAFEAIMKWKIYSEFYDSVKFVQCIVYNKRLLYCDFTQKFNQVLSKWISFFAYKLYGFEPAIQVQWMLNFSFCHQYWDFIPFQIRKLYVLSQSDDFKSYWMIFDVFTQSWTVNENKVNFGMNCCHSKLITLRGFHYLFHDLIYSFYGTLGPVNMILENGTAVDLNIGRPFEKEKVLFGNFPLTFELVPFYKRYTQIVSILWFCHQLILIILLFSNNAMKNKQYHT